MTENEDPNFERLWTVREVATFLHVSEKAVYRARRERGLPVVEVGGSLRFRPSSVREWAADHETVTKVEYQVRSARPSAPAPAPRPRTPAVTLLA